MFSKTSIYDAIPPDIFVLKISQSLLKALVILHDRDYLMDTLHYTVNMIISLLFAEMFGVKYDYSNLAIPRDFFVVQNMSKFMQCILQ